MSKRLLVFGILALVSMPLAAQQTVTEVRIVAKPRVYNGPCPATIDFIATIFVSRQPVKVEYQWERSDGAVGPRRQVVIRSAGQGVRESWTLGRGRERLQIWERLHVLAPTGISSPEQVVRVNCRP